MKRRNLLLLTVLLLQIVPVASFAEVCIDGIYYELDTNKKQAEVTLDKSDNPNYTKNGLGTYQGIVKIPTTVSYKDITYDFISIGTGAFSGNNDLETIEIPNSILQIGNEAFSACKKLQSLTIPKSVTDIGYGILKNSDAVTSIVVDKENTVYDSRNNCNAIIHTETNELVQGCQNTIIPNTVTRIGDCAFSGCLTLSSIDIPNSVTNIGDDAFSHTGIEELVLPNSVVYIGTCSFLMCPNLSSVTLSESLKHIPFFAFAEGAFDSITIPASVESIDNAFMGIFGSVTSVYFLSPTPPYTTDNMGLDYNYTTIHVPVGYKDAYENNDLWKGFNIIDIVSTAKLKYLKRNKTPKKKEVETATIILGESNFLFSTFGLEKNIY